MTPSLAEQIIEVVIARHAAERPVSIPALEVDRVMDLEAPSLPWNGLVGYYEGWPDEQEGRDDQLEERRLVLVFYLYGQPTSGVRATLATDPMACWIVQQLCGEVGAESPFFGLADRIQPGPRRSQLAKGGVALCWTELQINVDTSHLTTDLTRRA